MAKVGIVTVLYNSEKVLSEFFESLDNQTFKNFTLYVVDNNSPDDSLTIALDLSKKVSFKCVFFPEDNNWGVAKGNNIGIKAAKYDGCDYIILSNNDIVLDKKDTLDLLIEKMEKNPEIDILCPKIYYYGSNLIWAAGGDYIKADTTTCHFGVGENDNGQFDSDTIIRYTPTCFVVIRRRVFDEIGMMDERYFVYYDDTDFMYRAWKNKKRIMYTPVTSILHNESSSTGSGSVFQKFYLERNRLIFTKINRSNSVFWGLVIQRIIALTIRDVWILKRTHWIAEFKGLKEGIKFALGN